MPASEGFAFNWASYFDAAITGSAKGQMALQKSRPKIFGVAKYFKTFCQVRKAKPCPDEGQGFLRSPPLRRIGCCEVGGLEASRSQTLKPSAVS